MELFSHPFTFWILCLLRWSRGRFRFHRRKRTWQVITLSHNRLTFLPNDFPRTAGLEPSDRVFGMDFLVGKKKSSFSDHILAPLGYKYLEQTERILGWWALLKKAHTHFPQQIGGGSWHVRVPFLKEASNIGADWPGWNFDEPIVSWFFMPCMICALISLMSKESNQICGPVIQPVDHGPDGSDASFVPRQSFGNFGQGPPFFFDLSGLACKNIPTMQGYLRYSFRSFWFEHFGRPSHSDTVDLSEILHQPTCMFHPVF